MEIIGVPFKLSCRAPDNHSYNTIFCPFFSKGPTCSHKVRDKREKKKKKKKYWNDENWIRFLKQEASEAPGRDQNGLLGWKLSSGWMHLMCRERMGELLGCSWAHMSAKNTNNKDGINELCMRFRIQRHSFCCWYCVLKINNSIHKQINCFSSCIIHDSTNDKQVISPQTLTLSLKHKRNKK